MAGLCTRRSPRSNPLPTGKDKLAGGAPGAPNKGSGTSTPTFATSRVPTPAPAPASASGPPGLYTDVNLQKATKLVLKSFVKGQQYGQVNSAPRERALKVRNPDLYYRSSHIECYYFCRQCEDYFNTAGVTDPQRIFFAALFLQDRINFCWQQHKTQVEWDRIAPLTWDKFKTFLQQSFGESIAFVNNIWGKIKKDSQYQQEKVQDWASHLQYLQSILVEFDFWYAFTKDVLCRYFYKDLRLSIRLWIDKEGRDLNS